MALVVLVFVFSMMENFTVFAQNLDLFGEGEKGEGRGERGREG
jgi:hypothetical protein